jgi:hypothetical protein
MTRRGNQIGFEDESFLAAAVMPNRPLDGHLPGRKPDFQRGLTEGTSRKAKACTKMRRTHPFHSADLTMLDDRTLQPTQHPLGATTVEAEKRQVPGAHNQNSEADTYECRLNHDNCLRCINQC